MHLLRPSSLQTSVNVYYKHLPADWPGPLLLFQAGSIRVSLEEPAVRSESQGAGEHASCVLISFLWGCKQPSGCREASRSSTHVFTLGRYSLESPLTLEVSVTGIQLEPTIPPCEAGPSSEARCKTWKWGYSLLRNLILFYSTSFFTEGKLMTQYSLSKHCFFFLKLKAN